MARNDANEKPPVQPAVAATPINALWQKITPETSAQVSGGGSRWT